MSNEKRHIDPAILERAAMWHARLTADDVSNAQRAAHMTWLLEDPAHLLAYEQVSEAVHSANSYEQQARAAFANDFATQERPQKNKPFWQTWGWPQLVTGLAVAAALLFITIFPNTSFYDTPANDRVYIAESGGLRKIKLADGSRVTLLSDSSISVQMDASSRNINLIKGRGFFDVVSDENRPFVVNTGEHIVRVVGTRFEVIKGSAFDSVSVNKGLVAVSSAQDVSTAQQAPVLIEPGTVALYHKGENSPKISKVPASTIGSWTEGTLAFQDTPLEEVVSKLDALFPEATINIVGGGVASISFSGTLVVSDIHRMLTDLSAFLDLSLEKEGDIYSLSAAQADK